MATPRSSLSVSAPELTAAVPTRADGDGAAGLADRGAPPLSPAATWALRISRLAILAQFVWMFAFTTVVYQRGSLSADFSTYNQGRWLLAHGTWWPHLTTNGHTYWHTNAPLFMWVLGPLTRVPPGGLWLLWLQVAAISASEWIALTWVVELVSARRQRAVTGVLDQRWDFMPWAIGLVGLMLVADPFIYETAAFDFHIEGFAVFFAILTARELFGKARRRTWIWAILLLLIGTLAAVYLLGIGICGFVWAGKDRRRMSAAFVAMALVWILVPADREASGGPFRYLAGRHTAAKPGTYKVVTGAIAHPGRLLSQLSGNLWNLWANLAPGGIIGVFNPLGMGIAIPALVTSLLAKGHRFAIPLFQDFPTYVFVPVGTVAFLAALAYRRKGRLGTWAAAAVRPTCAVLAALSVAWAIIFLPHYPSKWLTVTPSGGQAVEKALKLVPGNAEVIASQGIAGRFSDRRDIRLVYSGPATFPVGRNPVYFVLSADQGIEVPVQSTYSLIEGVAALVGAPLEHQAGVWVFRWQPPPGTSVVKLPGPQNQLPGWALPSPEGAVTTIGPSYLWHIAGNGKTGYVVHGDYWNEQPGNYVATAKLSTTGPADVQVWNSNTKTLLARRQLAGTTGQETVRIPFVQPLPGSRHVFVGWGPLRITPIRPAAGQPVEIRIFNPSDSLVNVYNLGVKRAPTRPSTSPRRS